MDAFDADVLIYAAAGNHPLGRRVRLLFEPPVAAPDSMVGVGSVLLIPELLTKPLRSQGTAEMDALAVLLGRLELLTVDAGTARLAAVLGARYGLRAADAVHLATAVNAGADRFITNNRSDFSTRITEVEVVHPDQLPEGI
jgi:predicted nucleic acid-binding protein